MNNIERTQILWLNNTIDSLLDMLDNGEFTQEEAHHVEETVKVLNERKERISKQIKK